MNIFADLIELARQSDYLMVACKGGPDTYRLVSAAVIDALGPNGTLINVARGSVVDEPALIARWRKAPRPCRARRVRERACPVARAAQLPNVIVQPHHGSATFETRTAIGQLMIDNLSAHFGPAAAHAGSLSHFPRVSSPRHWLRGLQLFGSGEQTFRRFPDYPRAIDHISAPRTSSIGGLVMGKPNGDGI